MTVTIHSCDNLYRGNFCQAIIDDSVTKTIESPGQLGYELMPDSRPLTIGEFKNMMSKVRSSPLNKEFVDKIFYRFEQTHIDKN